MGGRYNAWFELIMRHNADGDFASDVADAAGEFTCHHSIAHAVEHPTMHSPCCRTSNDA